MGMAIWDFQTALYNRLVANTTLTALVDADHIHDHVPTKESYPFVVVGDDMSTEWDTKGRNGEELAVQIHVWDQNPGLKWTKQILQAIYAALHNVELTLGVDYHNVLLQYVGSQTFVEPDNVTRHGVIRFRALIEEV